VERAADGKLPCLFETTERADVARAIAFAKKHDLKGAIHGAALAGEMAEEIKAGKLDVIVPALGVGADRRALKAVINLHKQGVRFGFGLDSPWNNTAQLRLSAALCVREGLDPKAAWNALTSDAARIAGVGDRLGRIERGLDADIVLWSGDPLDLGSRVVAVYIGGVHVTGGGR
jgi:imidazolonepropionase-like amidohydrolase